MNFKFKRTLSIVLTLLLMFSCCVPAFAGGENGKVELSVSSNSSFKWGDDIVFTVTIANNTDKRISNVNLVSEAKGVNKYFSRSDDSVGTIEYITPGATRTVDLILKTKKISSIESFFRSISTFFKNLFSKFSRSYSYTKKIKVGMSNITFGISADYEVSEQNNNSGVNLDDPEPDVEIYSFATDTYDILIGETQEVTFTSEIFANIELEDDAVKVIDGDNNIIGTMNDVGEYGDETENDGIYTLCVDLSSDEICSKSYRSTVDGNISNEVIIGFYRELTENDHEAYAFVLDEISKIANGYIDSDGYLVEGKEAEAISAVKNKLEQLKSSEKILSFNNIDTDFEINVTVGYSFTYMLMKKGVESGVGSCSLATIQPFRGQWDDESLNNDSDSMTDGSAQLIEDTFDEYEFSANLDNQAGTLEAAKNLSDYDVIIINTHGTYNSVYGSLIALGERRTDSQSKNYSADISAGRIREVTADGKSVYAITGGFISKYCGDMDGAFVYIGSCKSAVDMNDSGETTYELAQSFIDKGATAVVGTDGTVNASYDYDFGIALFESLVEKNGDKYNTLSQAFVDAVSAAGANDSHGTSFGIYPDTNTARNYRLHEDEIGNIAGVIKEASYGDTVSNALIRAYKNGELVSSCRTNSNGSYNLELPAGEYIVKISAGGFKTAKIAVTVRKDATTYNETFLLIYNGLSSGYANGSTINAITGQLLPNVQINIRNGWNNQEGEIIKTISSNENGYYEVELPAGWYTFECYKDEFITTYKNIVVFIYDFMSQDISVAPELGEGYYRAVLTWGEDPSDLDSHLFGSTEDYSYRVYYSDKYGYDNDENVVAFLDVDDTTSYGPETTTFFIENDGKYEFYIDWYSGYGTWASSGGKVEVYNGAYLINTYYVPSVNHNNGSWKVFTIEDGVYTSHNIIQAYDIY